MPQYTDAVKGQTFKHLDTTKLIAIRFVDQDGNYATPNPDHKWTAKIAIQSGSNPGYIGDYPAYPADNSLIVRSKDLTKLVPGKYQLEAWETFTDTDDETTIWPTPQSAISFTIEPNITDQAGEMINKITFQDVVNSAVTAAGLNLTVGDTVTLPAGSQARVEQKLVDGKNQFSFYIPAGKQGGKGDPGDKGDPGESAYQVWLDLGNTGTEQDFFKALKGDKGDTGAPGKDGSNGQDGKSAYQVWLDAGHKGTQDDFFAFLKGDKGDTGETGKTGADGKNGVDGESAYQIWLGLGNKGTETDFINALKGAKGDTGNDGPRGFQGPAGKNFRLKQTFPSIQAMQDSKGKDFEDGDFTMISSAVGDEDNAKVYVWDGTNFNYVGDLSGSTGIQGPVGPAPTIHIGQVTKLSPDQSPTLTLDGKDGNYTLNAGLPQGQTGATGPIAKITIGNVATVPAGSAPQVTLSTTSDGYALNFALPEEYKPQRGTDYWTDADKNSIIDELKKYVDSAMTDAFNRAKAEVEDAVVNGKY